MDGLLMINGKHMENRMKLDDLGVPPFKETPIYMYIYTYRRLTLHVSKIISYMNLSDWNPYKVLIDTKMDYQNPEI